MLKAIFAVVILSLFFFSQASALHSLLTCLPNNASAVSVVGAFDAFSVGVLTNHYSVQVNAAGTYVFAIYNNAVVRIPFTSATSTFNTASAVRIGARPLSLTGACVAARNSICNPYTVFYDQVTDRLWVSDYGLRRVVRYDNVSIVNYFGKVARAKSVVGASSWGYIPPVNVVDGFNLAGPADVVYDSARNNLYVLDQFNDTINASRILVYNSFNIQAKFAAYPQRVYGEPNVTVLIPTTELSARTLGLVVGLGFDFVRNVLYAADTSNNRVLVWEDAGSRSNWPNADFVIGQTAFNTNLAATTAFNLRNPTSVYIDSRNRDIYIADRGNNRVIIYRDNADAFGVVVGQANFISGLANQGRTIPAAFTLSLPYQAVYAPTIGHLFVADNGNNRLVAYFCPASVGASPSQTPIFFTTGTTGTTSGRRTTSGTTSGTTA